MAHRAHHVAERIPEYLGIGKGYPFLTDEQNRFSLGWDSVVLSGKPDLVASKVLLACRGLQLNLETTTRHKSDRVSYKQTKPLPAVTSSVVHDPIASGAHNAGATDRSLTLRRRLIGRQSENTMPSHGAFFSSLRRSASRSSPHQRDRGYYRSWRGVWPRAQPVEHF